MPTNEEIINEKLSEVISRLGISDLYEMLDKARADTAKKIFKKFEDKVIFIRGDNEDIGIYLSSAKNYFTLKKEFNIEE